MHGSQAKNCRRIQNLEIVTGFWTVTNRGSHRVNLLVGGLHRLVQWVLVRTSFRLAFRSHWGQSCITYGTLTAMNLVQILTLIGLFFGGLWIGVPLATLVPFMPHGLTELICGALSVFLLAWPIYKRLGWLPQPPVCLRCSEREYIIISCETSGVKWMCKHCSQIIVLKSESVLVLGTQGEVITQLELCWPKFIGRWKKGRPF